MLILKCDWCKKEIDPNYTNQTLINFTWGHKSLFTDKERHSIDVCHECAQAFIRRYEEMK